VTRLPPAVYQTIKDQAEEGLQHMQEGRFRSAFDLFLRAFETLPTPREQWNAAGWLLVALGETSVQAGSYATALAPLEDAMECPGAIGNPWVHLRLGQVCFELGHDQRAGDELARAYMGGGRKLFAGQEPKYFALVEKLLRPPPGMDRLP
jgi:tetratricopeptide (TPR) repeat protein